MHQNNHMILQEGQVIWYVSQMDRYLGEAAFAVVYRVINCFLGLVAKKVFKTSGMSK